MKIENEICALMKFIVHAGVHVSDSQIRALNFGGTFCHVFSLLALFNYFLFLPPLLSSQPEGKFTADSEESCRVLATPISLTATNHNKLKLFPLMLERIYSER